MTRLKAVFHNSLSPQEFLDLQHQCRRIWKKWLSRKGFFANFYRHFQVGSHKKTENASKSATTV
jgi:uncharacterized protein YprB with RNaseH-like and TPR domain